MAVQRHSCCVEAGQLGAFRHPLRWQAVFGAAESPVLWPRAAVIDVHLAAVGGAAQVATTCFSLALGKGHTERGERRIAGKKYSRHFLFSTAVGSTTATERVGSRANI